MKNETEIWKSRALAHEENYLQMLKRVDSLTEQRDRLAEALRKLADCDWVITPHDRMDAVREIARKALQSLTPNEKQ